MHACRDFKKIDRTMDKWESERRENFVLFFNIMYKIYNMCDNGLLITTNYAMWLWCMNKLVEALRGAYKEAGACRPALQCQSLETGRLGLACGGCEKCSCTMTYINEHEHGVFSTISRKLKRGACCDDRRYWPSALFCSWQHGSLRHGRTHGPQPCFI